MKNPTPIRSAAALLLCTAAMVTAPAHAWTWNSEVYTFADCDPSESSPGARPGATKSCSTSDATAHAETTFTSMKASIRTSATAPDGNYYAGSAINDSLLATATDTRLVGTAGTVRFSVAFDGQVSGPTGFVFSAAQPIYYPEYNSSSLQILPVTTNFFGAQRTVDQFGVRLQADRTIDAVLSWELPVVFGTRSNYQIGMSVLAYGPNAVADFSHTWTLVGLDAFDAAGQAVAANFSVGSGAALPTTPVPEPQSLALMLAGLGLLGWRLRRA